MTATLTKGQREGRVMSAVSKSEILRALEAVRDKRETVSVGPFTFSHEHDRGADRCVIEIKRTVTDFRTGEPAMTTGVSGFAFSAVSLKRMAASLQRQSESA